MSEGHAELRSILEGSTEESTVVEEVTTEVETPEVEVAETETTEEVETKGENETEPPAVVEDPPEATPDIKGVTQAMLDERRKRQDAERELELFKQEKESKPKPDFWEDPEKAITSVKQELTLDFENRLLNMSEAAARDRHEDFQVKADVFLELANASPQLFSEMKTASDPAEFAYKHAEKFLAFKEMGNPSEYRQKIEAELRTKIEAEMMEKSKKLIEEEVAKRIPAGFTETSSKNNPDKDGYAGPTPLNAIVS